MLQIQIGQKSNWLIKENGIVPLFEFFRVQLSFKLDLNQAKKSPTTNFLIFF